MEVAHNALIYSELLCAPCRHRGPCGLGKVLMISWKERVSGMDTSFVICEFALMFGGFAFGFGFGLGFI